MSKLEKRPQEAPKTIKIKTLIISVAFVLVTVASFISGWFYHVSEQSRFDGSVKREVSSQVELLKDQK